MKQEKGGRGKSMHPNPLCTWTLLISTFTQIVTAFGATVSNSTSLPSTLANLPSILEKAHSLSPRHSHGSQMCYVCLPPDDSSSRDAQEILKMFQNVPSCREFEGAGDKTKFEFKCPDEFTGCALKIQGENIYRSCAQFPLNDCKTANGKELCFCNSPLCNGNKWEILKAAPAPVPSSSRPSTSTPHTTSDEEEERRWDRDETDDEDLLEMADEESSGDGPYPPGVIDLYTTTSKPTLVPNRKGDANKVKVTSPPSGARRVGTIGSGWICLILLFLLRASH